MPLSSQSNPRKLQSINTLRKTVDIKAVNRKKGTMKINHKFGMYEVSLDIQIILETYNEEHFID